jgi:hypothetical protein
MQHFSCSGPATSGLADRGILALLRDVCRSLTKEPPFTVAAALHALQNVAVDTPSSSLSLSGSSSIYFALGSVHCRHPEVSQLHNAREKRVQAHHASLSLHLRESGASPPASLCPQNNTKHPPSTPNTHLGPAPRHALSAVTPVHIEAGLLPVPSASTAAALPRFVSLPRARHNTIAAASIQRVRPANSREHRLSLCLAHSDTLTNVFGAPVLSAGQPVALNCILLTPANSSKHDLDTPSSRPRPTSIPHRL